LIDLALCKLALVEAVASEVHDIPAVVVVECKLGRAYNCLRPIQNNAIYG
jgi:hypothetical protein